ncbi:MAG TPA: Smr/MutS family protein [Rubricoccaceae bacterium]|nr:Smr/MutS family protein [Rubricoccaceae bacterium]
MRLTDDGATVVLDLHGATVEEALRAARRALVLAMGAGRHRLDLVHGASTTDPYGAQRTIKSALYDWLDAGLPAGVHHGQRGDSRLSLYLDVTARPRPGRLTLRDLR